MTFCTISTLFTVFGAGCSVVPNGVCRSNSDPSGTIGASLGGSIVRSANGINLAELSGLAFTVPFAMGNDAIVGEAIGNDEGCRKATCGSVLHSVAVLLYERYGSTGLGPYGGFSSASCSPLEMGIARDCP